MRAGGILFRWTGEHDQRLRDLHGLMPIIEVAQVMGTTRSSIRARVTRLGIRKCFDSYSSDELAAIRSVYENATFGEDVRLNDLARRLGRPKASVCRQARLMGLSNIARPKKRETKPPYKIGREGSPELRAHMSASQRQWHANNPHPRGMLGKHHTPEVKERLRKSSTDRWLSLTPKEREQEVENRLKAALAKNGYVGSPPFNRDGATWKAGWREIGDKRVYFRSRWEANYARYLQWLKECGDILDWEYEPETFWFDKIKRGVRSYKPDFRVHELNGDKLLHEVKGWMDARSKTTLRRMAKYHPSEKIVLIREKDMRAISRFSALIPDWESDARKSRV